MTRQQNSRIFHLGDVLSVTTSRLLSPRYMDGLYDLIQFLTDEPPNHEQLPALMDACRVYLIRLRPDLQDLDTDELVFENWRAWLQQQQAISGEWVEIRRPEAGEILLP